MLCLICGLTDYGIKKKEYIISYRYRCIVETCIMNSLNRVATFLKIEIEKLERVEKLIVL